MKHLSIAIILLGWFALIGFAVYMTNSGYPLWALLLTPNVKFSTEKEKRTGRNDERSI